MGGATNTDKTWTWSGEAVEADLDRLIERQARAAREAGETEANRFAKEWAESLRRYDRRTRDELRRQWLSHHEYMASLHKSLADEHRQKAEALGGLGA